MTTELTWEDLTKTDAPALGDIRVYETDVRVPGGAVLLGLDAEDLRHLLVPLSADEESREDRRSRGVHVLDRALIDAGTSRRFCDVASLKAGPQELFGILAAEMLSELRDNRRSPAQVCIRVLDRWRELLERESVKLLGTKQLAALLAELHFLERVVELTGPSALAAWAGPEGAIHDLRSSRAALEVKSSLARYGRIVEIHGQEQLRPPKGGTLYLGVLQLEAVGTGGMSAPDKVTSLLDLGVDREGLLHRLARVGYAIDDQEAYSLVRFEIRESRVYEVTDEFPRIVPESFIESRVPAGVVRLVYQIDLTGEPPVPLGEPEVEQALRTLEIND